MGLFDFFKGFFKSKSGQEKEKQSQNTQEYITWDDSYSVSVKQLDDEHKKLVVMINELHEAMQVGRGKEMLSTILGRMINYVGTHFSNEEKYMEKFSYPDYEVHKQEHNDFVKKTLEFQQNFNDGKMGLSIEVMFFLKEWLLNHIKGSDQQYGPFFNKKGLI
ncbi:MAG: bacteriohemerythrin [Candidatus Eremiobacterota bacterium]